MIMIVAKRKTMAIMILTEMMMKRRNVVMILVKRQE